MPVAVTAVAMSVLLGLATIAALVLGLMARRASARNAMLQQELRSAAAREQALARDVGAAKRETADAETDQQFLTRFVRDLPHVAHEMHAAGGPRQIACLLLNTVVRLLEPKKVFVAVARRPASTDDEAGGVLAVEAVSPDGAVPLGTVFGRGKGEIGFAAEVQRTLDRRDFDGQPAGTRQRLRHETERGQVPDVVAPMVFKSETVGIIVVEGLKRSPAETKDVLRLIALVGAVSLYTQAKYSEMTASANTDGLTGIFNKRYLTFRLAEEIQTALAQGRYVSVFLFDIDHFKHYNDRNGHVAGDQLLKELTKLVQNTTRRDTIFGRFGGEEFLLIFPGTAKSQALCAAENVRVAIARFAFTGAADQPLGCVSVSGGVAESPMDGADSAALLRAADQALYAAKGAGRNRVFPFEPQYLGGEEAQQPLGGDIETPATGPVFSIAAQIDRVFAQRSILTNATSRATGASAGDIGADELVAVDDETSTDAS